MKPSYLTLFSGYLTILLGKYFLTGMIISTTIPILTVVLMFWISNATGDEGSVCTLAPTYGWVAVRCNGGYAIICNGIGLTDVPTKLPRYDNSSTPCLLDLSRNNITHLKNHSFVNISEIKFLFLFDNQISRIDSDAFVNLTSLLSLNLTRNRLRNPTSFGEGVFEPFMDVDMIYVSLKHNYLGAGEDLTNLFRPFKKVEYIDISYNELLTFSGMKYVLKALANSSVNTINFNHVHRFYEMGTLLKLEDIEPLINIPNVTRLYLDLNKIEVVEKKVFDLLGNYSSLKSIGVGGNRLTAGKYTQSLYKMVHVKHMYLSTQHSNIDPFYQQHFEDYTTFFEYETATLPKPNTRENGASMLQTAITNCTNCREECPRNIICLCIPPNLERVDWRKSYIELEVQEVKVCEPSNLRYIDVSYNIITEWIGPVRGLESLENLNLADNYCQRLEPHFFDTFYGLRYLNLSYNFLGPVFSKETASGVNYFRNLTELISLDLSENRITMLPSNLFKNLNHLKYLDLSRNILSEWKGDLNAKCFRKLDLRRNKLEFLPLSLREFLDNSATLPTTNACNASEKVAVLLSGNSLRCNCDNRPFLRWLGKSPVDFDFSDNLECHLEDGSSLKLVDRDMVLDLVTSLDTECFPYVSIILSICMFALGVAVCVLIYRNRWKLRYLYYTRRRRHNTVGDDRIFEYDAFISYASSEGRFIKQFLVKELEKDRGFKVWVADRDAMAGVSIAENLAHAIGSSKKTILILSRRYFKEGWCDYEMNLARVEGIETHRKLMIIVLFEDLPAKDIPLDYQRLLKTEEFLNYPTDPKYNETFWEALSSAILRS